MVAVDTNVLVFAHRKDSPKHEIAARKIRELSAGTEPWALPVTCIAEFCRVVTHPSIFKVPHTPDETLEALARLLPSPALQVLFPGERFMALFQDLIRKYEIRGNLVYDAQIVALCRESGVDFILTDDRDFDRFREITILKLT